MKIATETALLLACTRTDPDLPRIQELLARAPDWPTVVRRAQEGWVIPLLGGTVRTIAAAAAIPADVVDLLRRLAHREVALGLAQRATLRAALLRLRDANVPVMLLRDAVVPLVYPTAAWRPMRKLAFLVRPPDHAHAARLLEAMWHDRVHDRIAADLPADDAWTRARPAEIESIPVLVPGDEDLLLHLAVTLASAVARPLDQRWLGRLCDVAEACRTVGPRVDWTRVVDLARRTALTAVVGPALHLAAELLGAPVPDAVRSALPTLRDDEPIAVMTRRWLHDATHGVVRGTLATTPSIPLHDPTRTTATRPTPGEIAVTYDDRRATDGVGSQLLRIYGLYALARALDVKYVHTPLARVSYQGFTQFLTNRIDPAFVEPYNAFFTLPSDDFDVVGCERVRVHLLGADVIEHYRARAAHTGRPVLLVALHHYGYTDHHPAAFHALRAVSPYRTHRPTGPLRVCLHVRRGDVSVPGRDDGTERVLPDAYYVRVCQAVVRELQRHDVPFVVRIHSEVPLRRTTIYPDTPGLYFHLDAAQTVDPSHVTFDAFDALPNRELVLNVDAREALDDFATADVLILSLSALGYIGGLLNPHGMVVHAPWWHPPLPDWLTATRAGDVDPDAVAAQVADLLRRRAGSTR